MAPQQWSTWREAVGVCRHGPHARRTGLIALVVGTILFGINQADVVFGGRATAVTWVKVGLTYLVPYAVSNAGILIASRQRAPENPPEG